MRKWLRVVKPAIQLVALSSAFAAAATVTTAKDSTTVLRNPTMGLVSYGYGYGSAPGPYAFAANMGGDWDKYSNIIYMRTYWKYFEPVQGQYAWNTSPTFKSMMADARKKGYRLGIRVIAQDDGTPDYVIKAIQDAGQNPYSKQVFEGRKLAEIRNKIWQTHFATFVAALGKAFDDPTITEYIDINGLGPWGEGAPWVEGFDNVEKEQPVYFDWHVSQFDKAFKKVLLLDNYGFDFDVAIDKKYNILWRQDGLGGSDSANWVPHDTTKNASRLIITEPWGGGTLTHYLTDAMLVHANAVSTGFDLKTWTSQPKILTKAIQNLGYRLRPQTLQYPSPVASGSQTTVQHTWVNDGVGYLPNDYFRWNRKYAVAFALFSANGTSPSQVVIDDATNPGLFEKGKSFPLSTNLTWTVPPGTYKLAVGILDKTRPADSSLALAIAQPTKKAGWYILGNIDISNATGMSNRAPQLSRANVASFRGNHLTLSMDASYPTSLRLASLDGRQVFSTNLAKGTMDVPVGNLPQGVYLLEVENLAGHVSQTLIKQ